MSGPGLTTGLWKVPQPGKSTGPWRSIWLWIWSGPWSKPWLRHSHRCGYGTSHGKSYGHGGGHNKSHEMDQRRGHPGSQGGKGSMDIDWTMEDAIEKKILGNKGIIEKRQ